MSARRAVELYDAELVRVDATQQTVTFRHRDCGLILRTRCPTLWKSGAVGRLTVFPSGEFGFYVYPDPRLRRLEAFDDEDGRQWGWRLGEYRLWAKAGVIPGVNGSVVKEDVVSLQMPVPREFLDLCAAHQLTPPGALRAFIADVCALQSLCACPREDGYSSSGSDERSHAQAYWERAFAWRAMGTESLER